MAQMKVDIRDILFWILLIISVGLLLWYVFGDSPAEVAIFVTIASMIVLKVWHISDRQIKSDMNVRHGFDNIKQDINIIKEDISLIKNKLEV